MPPHMTVHVARSYQAALIEQAFQEWRSSQNLLIVLPTGGGKSFIVAAIVSRWNSPVAVIAHRAELVAQLALALAREGVRHRIIGASGARSLCVTMQMDELKRSYVDANAKVAVCSVDTLIKVAPSDPWLRQVTLWVQDEAHHVLKNNKWGKAAALFPHARGLGVTATPLRADGQGLGRHADGLFDALLVGPSMRELIEQGFLTDYRVCIPLSQIDLSGVTVTSSGDYSPVKLATARKRSTITGDVVANYLKFSAGRLGVTFDCNVEAATETAAAYRAAGVPAEVVSGETPDALRAQIQRRFARRELLQLVNVDLFGEGYDLPAIETVSFARPTLSYGLYVQQFGRACRPMEGKDHALIIDHVDNCRKHGRPDAPRVWSLDGRERRTRGPNDAIPLRICANQDCQSDYERVLPACPYCNEPAPPPSSRSSPEYVDGDLYLLDPAALSRMLGEVDRIDRAPVFPTNVGADVTGAIRKRHLERQAAQVALRDAMALWGGWQQALGRDVREAQRRFFFRFHVDVMTAKALGAREAQTLQKRIEDDLLVNRVRRAT